MENNSIDSNKQNNKVPGPVAAGLFFSLTTILMVYGHSLLIFKNSYLRSGMGELFFVLAPVLIFLIAGRYNIKETLKLNRTKSSNYIIIVFLMIFGMPVAGILNAVVLGIIRLVFGKNLPVPQFIISDMPTLLVAILVIGVSAAICEEVLFRGLISKGFQPYGAVTALVITSILFGILHRDIQKAVSTILLGALIGFIVYRTGSIYAGMVAHFTNNSVAVLLTFAATKMKASLDQLGIQQTVEYDISKLSNYTLIVTIIFGAVMFMGFISAFISLLYAFYRNTKPDRIIEPELTTETATIENRRFSPPVLLSVLPGLILILLTFTGQLLELMDIKAGVLFNILRLLAII